MTTFQILVAASGYAVALLIVLIFWRGRSGNDLAKDKAMLRKIFGDDHGTQY